MNFDDSTQQALLELIEKGVVDSAGKLAQVSRTEWKTETVSIRSAPLADIQSVLAGDQTEHSGAFFLIPGGVFVVMFTQKSGKAMAKAFLPACDEKQVTLLAHDAVAEISNIVVHSVANTIADTCDIALFVSAPEVVNGKKGYLLELAGSKFDMSDEPTAIVAYIHLYSVSLSSECTIAFLLNSIWRERLLKALE